MMIQAVLGNPHHPEYGVATIPFPIPHDQYAHCMELLESLEIGDAVKADCQVQEINSFYSVLKRTEMLTVNVEELNYLAKRLDSFDTGEAAQFQAMAHKLELFELKDLINLTFCCQQATVITDFSDLSAVGRDHYMNLHGGSAKTEELDALDGEATARRLIESGSGTITPYGVVYDNGMKLEQVYDGRSFPCYYYEPNAITVAVTAKSEPEDTEHITWLYLPVAQEEIDRVLQRAGITDPADARLRLEDMQLPNEVDVLLDMQDVSTAVYRATQRQLVSGDVMLQKLLECLNGKGITSAGHLSARNFSFCEEIIESDGKLNFYLQADFDVDAAFGTFVCTDQNDDWLNIYANYDVERDRLCDTLELNLCKGDGSEECWSYPLNAAEQEVLLHKMEAFCQQQTGMSLHDFARQLRESGSQTPEMQM